MKILARGNELYIKNRELHRVGQVILQHNEGHSSPVIDVYNARLNREELINKLLIGKEDFYELLMTGNHEKLLNVPLYSRRYYNGIAFADVRKEPIDFDFIQVQGKLLIWAENGEVKQIGELDDLASFLLMNNGLIISPEVVVRGIKYAVEHGKRVANVQHPLVQSYLALKRKYGALAFRSIKDKGNYYEIITTEGYFYFKDDILTNFKPLLKRLGELPFESGLITKTADGFSVSHFTLKEEPIDVEVTTDDTDRIRPFIKVGEDRFYLDGSFSLRDGIIKSVGRYKVNVKTPHEHLGVVDFVRRWDGLKAKSKVIMSNDDEPKFVYEDADAFEPTDKFSIPPLKRQPKPEKIYENSELLQSLGFTREGKLYYAMLRYGNKDYLVVFGYGESNDFEGVFNIYRNNFLVLSDIEPRAFRIVRIDDFFEKSSKWFKVEGLENIKTFDVLTRIAELKLVAELSRGISIKVNVEKDKVSVTFTDEFRKVSITEEYGMEIFRVLSTRLDNGSFKVGFADFTLPHEEEGKEVYTLAVQRGTGREVAWFIRPQSKMVEIKLSRTYFYFNDRFSVKGFKIIPTFKPSNIRDEFIFDDLYSRTVAIPISKQMTLF